MIYYVYIYIYTGFPKDSWHLDGKSKWRTKRQTTKKWGYYDINQLSPVFPRLLSQKRCPKLMDFQTKEWHLEMGWVDADLLQSLDIEVWQPFFKAELYSRRSFGCVTQPGSRVLPATKFSIEPIAVDVCWCSKVGSNDLPTKFEGTGPQFADVLMTRTDRDWSSHVLRES